jgi:hypothetical protein
MAAAVPWHAWRGCHHGCEGGRDEAPLASANADGNGRPAAFGSFAGAPGHTAGRPRGGDSGGRPAAPLATAAAAAVARAPFGSRGGGSGTAATAAATACSSGSCSRVMVCDPRRPQLPVELKCRLPAPPSELPTAPPAAAAVPLAPPAPLLLLALLLNSRERRASVAASATSGTPGAHRTSSGGWGMGRGRMGHTISQPVDWLGKHCWTAGHCCAVLCGAGGHPHSDRPC